MSFVSVEFGLLLALVYALAMLLPARALPGVIVAASVIFYGGWDWHYVWLLLTVKGLAYLGGLILEKYRSRLVLGSVVVAIFSFLIYFKYAGFLVHSTNELLRATGHEAGFSFGIVYFANPRIEGLSRHKKAGYLPAFFFSGLTCGLGGVESMRRNSSSSSCLFFSCFASSFICSCLVVMRKL